MNAATRPPIERVTVPLVPRSTSGCCDLAVVYYGRFVAPLLRLYLAIAIPALCFVYGIERFVGGSLAVVCAVLLIASKPLGLLTIPAAWRTTFGAPFDWHSTWQTGRLTRADRLRRVSESLLSAGALLAVLALVAAVIEDSFGGGLIVRLGPGFACLFVTLATILVTLRAGLSIAANHRPSRPVRRALLWGLALRTLLAIPCLLAYLWPFPGSSALLVFVWMPICGMIIGARSFRSEMLALSEFDADLMDDQARRRQASIETGTPGLIVGGSAVILVVLLVAGVDMLIRTLGGTGPALDPFIESLRSGFFGFGPAVTRTFSNPAFGALLTAVALWVYHLARISWFFVFLDSRVRFDCWDMELRMAREARRLEGS